MSSLVACDHIEINVAECAELVLPDDDPGADIDPAIEIDHVIIDKPKATG